MPNLGPQISDFVLELTPATGPIGLLVRDEVLTFVPPSPVAPETPPSPVAPGEIANLVHDIIGDLRGTSPGPPTEPPGVQISVEIQDLLGVNPGPPGANPGPPDVNPGPPDVNPGPPTDPVGPLISAFAVETNPGPPEANPGPPNDPPGGLISAEAHGILQLNPGPPNIRGIIDLEL